MNLIVRHHLVKVIDTQITLGFPVEHGVNSGERTVDFRIIGKTDEDHQIGQLPHIVLSHRDGWHHYSQNIDYQ